MRNAEADRLNEEFVQLGVKLRECIGSSSLNSYDVSPDSTFTIRFRNWIKAAKLADQHKQLANSLNIDWSLWMKQQCPVFSKRSFEDYIRLAKIPNIEKHLDLGKAKIMNLIAHRTLVGEDPIETLMQELNLDPTLPIYQFREVLKQTQPQQER